MAPLPPLSKVIFGILKQLQTDLLEDFETIWRSTTLGYSRNGRTHHWTEMQRSPCSGPVPLCTAIDKWHRFMVKEWACLIIFARNTRWMLYFISTDPTISCSLDKVCYHSETYRKNNYYIHLAVIWNIKSQGKLAPYLFSFQIKQKFETLQTSDECMPDCFRRKL